MNKPEYLELQQKDYNTMCLIRTDSIYGLYKVSEDRWLLGVSGKTYVITTEAADAVKDCLKTSDDVDVREWHE